MKITRRQLRRIILESLGAQQDDIGLDVLDPCEAQGMEEAAFLARFPNWPVSLSEVIGDCGTGIMYAEVTFAGGERAGAEFNFDEYKGGITKEELKSKKKITKPELAKMYDAGVVSGLSDADEDTLEKVGVTKSLEPIAKSLKTSGMIQQPPEHRHMAVGVDHGKGLGYYYDDNNQLVAFTPADTIEMQVFK